jgi:hypothetical protein
VAWVSERKDVLSGFFGMLTLWAYAGYAARPGWGRYLLVVLLFALGLMAKPMLVTLPCVLLLLDYWPLKRFGPDNPLLPTLSTAASFAPAYAQGGRFEDAVAAARKGLKLAEAGQQGELVKQIKQQLDNYQRRQSPEGRR